MKQWTILAALALTMSTSATANEYEERAKKIAGLYKMGVKAMQDGETAAARAAFNEILTLDANHGHARYQLGQLKSNHGRIKMARRKALFKTTRLAKVDFENAPLAEVIDTLNHLATKATKNKFTPNFIIQDPAGKLKNARVNLQLNKVPLGAVLKYAMEQVGAGVRYDAHATIIYPLSRTRK